MSHTITRRPMASYRSPVRHRPLRERTIPLNSPDDNIYDMPAKRSGRLIFVVIFLIRPISAFAASIPPRWRQRHGPGRSSVGRVEKSEPFVEENLRDRFSLERWSHGNDSLILQPPIHVPDQRSTVWDHTATSGIFLPIAAINTE